MIRPEADHHHRLDDLLVWKRELARTVSIALPPQGSRPNPAVVDGMVVASTFTPGSLVALDRETGELRWKRDLAGYGHADVLHHATLLYAVTAKGIAAVRAADGSLVWKWRACRFPGECGGEVLRADSGTHLRFAPATGLIYERRFGGIGIIDGRSGRRLHHIDTASASTFVMPEGAPDVVDGTIYFIGVCHRARDHGSRLWRLVSRYALALPLFRAMMLRAYTKRSPVIGSAYALGHPPV